MKTLIFLSLFLIGVQSKAYMMDFERPVQMNFLYANSFWYDIMREDLKRKVKSLAIGEGGGHLIDIEDLQPRASFTKPHRFHLMKKFLNSNNSKCENTRPYSMGMGYSSYASSGEFHSLQKCIEERNWDKVRFKIRADSNSIEGYTFFPTITQLNDVIMNGGEGSVQIQERNIYIVYYHDDHIDFQVDALLYPIAEEYVRLTKEFQDRTWDDVSNDAYTDINNGSYVLTQSDRWWWNENIKPLLEKMLEVWNIFHKDYEPY